MNINRNKFALVIVACLALSAVADEMPKRVLLYDFDHIRDGHLVLDTAGVSHARHLSLTGKRNQPTPVELVAGVHGQAVRFAGTPQNRYLTINLASTINLEVDDFSVAFWYRSDQPGGTFLQSTTSIPYWQFVYFPGRDNRPGLKLVMRTGLEKTDVTVRVLSLPTNFAKSQWHHYALVVHRGGDIRVYLDGQLLGTVAIKQLRGPLKHVLAIGGPYNYLNGVMDQFMLYQGLLSTEAVRTVYEADKSTLGEELQLDATKE